MEERRLAKIKRGSDVVIEDHGLLILDVTFEYDGGGAVQGLPIIVQGKSGGQFIKQLLEAVGVESVRVLDGKSCWVTATMNGITKIEPLHKKDGIPLDIKNFQKKHSGD